MIVRTIKSGDYFSLSRTAVRDGRLSYKALGLHTYLMSKADNWRAMESELVGAHEDGRTSVRSAIQELIKYGYMVRVRVVNDKGQVVDWRLDTYEAPDLNPYFVPGEEPTTVTEREGDEPESDFPTVDYPESDFPQVDFPQVENETLIKRESNKERVIKNISPDKSGEKAKTKKPSGAYVHPETGVSTNDIKTAYVEAIESWEPNVIVNHGETSKWAKVIAEKGYTPEQVRRVVDYLKAQDFWKGRNLGLGSVAKQLGAVLGNAQAKAAGRSSLYSIPEL